MVKKVLKKFRSALGTVWEDYICVFCEYLQGHYWAYLLFLVVLSAVISVVTSVVVVNVMRNLGWFRMIP